MGMEAVYRRLSKSEFTAIQNDPEKGVDFVCSSLPGFDTKSLIEIMANPESMKANQEKILSAFDEKLADPTRVDLFKEWHALHFLLTGDSELDSGHRPEIPLHNVVMGGHEANFEASYGPARYFLPDEVRVISSALSKISVDELKARFSADEFNAHEIYPNPRPGGWSLEEIEGLLSIYPKLVKFFEEASVAGEIVVHYLE